MNKLKEVFKGIYVEFFWSLALFCSLFVKGKKDAKKVLVLPAANLNGGFGEDIMITSFINNFANDAQVCILNGHKIIREDYRAINKNVVFLDGFNEKVNFLKLLFLIKDCALVYVIGADIMDGTYRVHNSINRLRVIELANRIGVKAQISGFSVSKNILPVVKAKFSSVAKDVKLKIRDVESYVRMKDFIPADRLILTNDIAFICPDLPGVYQSETFDAYKTWVHNVKASGKTVIGVCPNAIQAKKIGFDKYLSGFKSLLEGFLDAGDYAFVFLYHDIRPICDEASDSTISRILDGYFSAKNLDCFFTDQIKNGVELKGYVSMVDFTITGRMHLGISGLTYSKPMFGVSYANKFEGMVKLFDIDPNLCLIDYDKLDNSKEKIRLFTENFPAIQNSVHKHISSVKLETTNNYTYG
ncbi:polysaccharide pyruvyl transferase family protein [Pedobacter gandavensis]|uniref:polysaccharide pyruvyl transferase family protein n=1 Tax=Pedobacter gandavensis TaxID=2679963 RepID=UPI0024789160|nr:polysaccharide pyruvyl transferase family protein [Pedobacter gandavensis]WGQ12463.1 polysaccharide pyruvyl transferase family protein [Pedobacter gandavensis]